ncbi:MAG: hypothetical protein QNK23_08035 [Crocinitomicaceae bacterium]|nr:hypothetical protein [Crocinitomicaceae bacterium]
MRTLILTSVFSLLGSVLFGQTYDLIESDWYSDSNLLVQTNSAGLDSVAFLPLMNNCENLPFDTLEINSLENFEGYSIWQLEDHGLDRVNRVIKVELSWLGCCEYIESYYFLYTDDCTIKQLPMITNTACDFPEPYRDYIFPDEEHGERGVIKQVMVDYDENGEAVDLLVEDLILWEENVFDGCRR